MAKVYARELTLTFGALRHAAKLSQSIIASQDKGVTEKEDFSPVTVADFAIQALLMATFGRAFPDDTFVGEEDASGLRENRALLDRVWHLLQQLEVVEDAGCTIPSSKEDMCHLIDVAGTGKPSKTGRTWIFDPIDGTKTYVKGQLYAINIALLVDGQQMLGSVGCPNMAIDVKAPCTNEDVDVSGQGCIVYAVKGQGAYVRPMGVTQESVGQQGGQGRRRLAQADARDVRFVTCVSIVDSALDGVHDVIASRLGAVDFPGCDLVPWVLRWAALALGLGNTTVWVYRRRERLAKVWDHAGAMLLFEETGGKITDILGRSIDLTAGRKMSGNFGFVAAPAAAHSAVLDVVGQVLREKGHGEMMLSD